MALLSESDKAYFFQRLKEISEPLSTPVGCNIAWQGFLDYYGVAGLKHEVGMIIDKTG